MSNKIIGSLISNVSGDLLVYDGSGVTPINIDHPSEFYWFKKCFDNDSSFKQEVLKYIASQQFNSELASIIKKGNI